MLCKSEDRNPEHCLKEGRKVTRCAAELCVGYTMCFITYVSVVADTLMVSRMAKMRENCLTEFDAHWRCLEYNNQVRPIVVKLPQTALELIVDSITKHAEILKELLINACSPNWQVSCRCLAYMLLTDITRFFRWFRSLCAFSFTHRICPNPYPDHQKGKNKFTKRSGLSSLACRSEGHCASSAFPL